MLHLDVVDNLDIKHCLAYSQVRGREAEVGGGVGAEEKDWLRRLRGNIKIRLSARFAVFSTSMVLLFLL